MEEILKTEDTAPQEESVEEIVEEALPTTAETENNEQEVIEEPGTAAEETADNWTLPVRFNHELKELSLQEAQTYAQKGMHSEPIMNDLRYLAARNNLDSVKDLVKMLVHAADNARREELYDQIGNDEGLISTIVEAEENKWKQSASIILENEEKALAEENKSSAEKFATDFIELNKEFPYLKEFKDVPKDVVETAMKNNISLMDAYLRYKLAEDRRIAKANAKEEKNSQATAGSAKSAETDETSSLIQAMKKGIWS